MADARLVLFVQLLLAITGALAQITWDYNDQSKWPVNYCAGNRQSPIDVTDAKVDCTIPEFVGIDPNWQVENLKIQNNGHTVKIAFGEGAPHLTGGGLPLESYDLREVHFHWSREDDEGSEHTLAGKHFPMEVHLVHAKTEMALSDAVNTDGAIAVFGVFLEISQTENDALTQLMESVENVEQSGESADVETPFRPYGLLPLDINRFYRYEGSLTTPDCNEVVVWTVFSRTIRVTEQQLETFRKVQIEGSDFNYRELQPINGRRITQRSPDVCA